MPLYEYHCKKCGHVFEQLVRMSDTATPQCPKCGSKQVEKLLSAFATSEASSGGGSGNSCPTGTCPFS